jgi:hypothetical protein
MAGATDYTAKVAACVGRLLEPGEAIVAAAPAGPRGTMRAMTGDKREYRGTGRAELRGLGVADGRQFVVALTDRRFVWFRTTFTGRPKALAGALARGDVDALTLGEGRALGQRYAELRFVLRDGRRARFEVARLHTGLARALVDAFLPSLPGTGTDGA